MKSLSLIVIAYLALTIPADDAFATKDFSLRLPFTNTVVLPYEQLTGFRVKNNNQGLTIMCTVRDSLKFHPERYVYIDSSNYVRNPQDSPNGLYALNGDAPANYAKYNIRSIDPDYNSYIRFYGKGDIGTDTMIIECGYQTSGGISQLVEQKQ